MSGLTGFHGGLNGGNNIIHTWNSFQGYDDAFWTHGTHSLKFGGAVERMQLNIYNRHRPQPGPSPSRTLSDFLTNKPKRFIAGLCGHFTARGLRQTLFGLYVQDDWHARPNLTVNMGLRWEMTTVPTEVQGKLANLINITDPTPHLGSPFFSNPTLRNFEPRVGFAWDPFHNGKTAVRGGFGVFDVLPLPYQFIQLMRPRRSRSSAAESPTTFLQARSTQERLRCSVRHPTQETYVEQHPHRSYVMQWNLNVQRELVPSLTALVGYVGSRGVHLPFQLDDTDIVIPTLTPRGTFSHHPWAAERRSTQTSATSQHAL